MVAPVTPSVVQSAKVDVSGSTVTTLAPALGAGSTFPNSLMLVLISETSGSTQVVSAGSNITGGGSLWALALRYPQSGVSGTGCLEVWHTTAPPVAGTTAISITLASAQLAGCTLLEVSGTAPYCPPNPNSMALPGSYAGATVGTDVGLDSIWQGGGSGNTSLSGPTSSPANLGAFCLVVSFASSTETFGTSSSFFGQIAGCLHAGAMRYGLQWFWAGSNASGSVGFFNQTSATPWYIALVYFVPLAPLGFDLYNDPSATAQNALLSQQARLDKVDIDALNVVSAASGVIAGCCVGQGSTASPSTYAVTAGAAQAGGFYPFTVPALASTSVPAANATNPRHDLVIAVPGVSALGAAGSVQYLTGTPAAIPAEPQLPAGCVPLAVIDVPANATAGDGWGGPYGAGGGSAAKVQILDRRAFVMPRTLAPPTIFNPGTQTTYTMSSTTAANVDATNLKTTFVAPATGNVRFELCAAAMCSVVTAPQVWCLMSSSSVIVANTSVVVETVTSVTSGTAIIHVTGLTPGTSYTFFWGWYIRFGGSGTITMFAGGNPNAVAAAAGPASMVVLAE